jgi:hypothetical protein
MSSHLPWAALRPSDQCCLMHTIVCAVRVENPPKFLWACKKNTQLPSCVVRSKSVIKYQVSLCLDNISTIPVNLPVGSQHTMSDAHISEAATIPPLASIPAPPASSETEHPAAPSATVALLDLPTAETHDLIYCCRKCRTALFRPSQLQAPHDTGKHSFAYRKMTKDRESDKAGGPSSACTSYFLHEALPWMADTSVDVEGKLSCYKCKARVGEWYSEINAKLGMHPIVFGRMHGCVHLHRRDKLKFVPITFLYNHMLLQVA